MYELTEKEIISEGKKYVVYGIKYGDELTVDNISPCRDKVKSLAEKFNKFSLDVVHFPDAVEDFLLED